MKKSFIILNFDAQDDMYKYRKELLDQYGFVGNFCLSGFRCNKPLTEENKAAYNALLESGWCPALYAGVGARPADLDKEQELWNSYIKDFGVYCEENEIQAPKHYHCNVNKLGSALFNALENNQFKVCRCSPGQYKAGKSVFIKPSRYRSAGGVLVIPTTGIAKHTNLLLLKMRIAYSVIMGYSLSILAHQVVDCDYKEVQDRDCTKKQYMQILDFIKYFSDRGMCQVGTWDDLYNYLTKQVE